MTTIGPNTIRMKTVDIDDSMARSLLKARPRDAHKGTMGHAALFAGSYGMAGAAVLSARATLRSGVGKLTCFVDERIYAILQTSSPEAVFRILEPGMHIRSDNLSGFDAAGAGPGWGSGEENLRLLETLTKAGCPLILDAEALNMLAVNPGMVDRLPPQTVLTPHRGEYARLFGPDADPAGVSERHGCILVMKGPATRVYTPGGDVYRNTTGNPGMATAGSGDVLTGIILGLSARGYNPMEASCLGVFLHGRSGDLAAGKFGAESMIASDLTDFLGPAFLSVGASPI